jgi:hypothetical protein
MKVTISKDLAEYLLDHLADLMAECAEMRKYPRLNKEYLGYKKQYTQLTAALSETCETCKLKTDVHHIDCHGCSHFWPSMWEKK